MQVPERLALIGGSILLSSTLIFTLKSQASQIIPKVGHSISQVYDHVGDAKNDSEFGNGYRQAQQKGWQTGTWGSAQFYIDNEQNLYVGQGQLVGSLADIIGGTTADSLKTVHFTQNVQAPQNGYFMLSKLHNAIAIYGLEKMDTSLTQGMGAMFADDYNLNYVNISNFDMSKVDDISGMFSGDSSLHQLNIQSFGSSYNMGNLFQSTGINELTIGKDTNLWGGQGLQNNKWKASDGSIGDYPDGSHPGTWTRQ